MTDFLLLLMICERLESAVFHLYLYLHRSLVWAEDLFALHHHHRHNFEDRFVSSSPSDDDDDDDDDDIAHDVDGDDDDVVVVPSFVSDVVRSFSGLLLRDT